MRVALLLAGPGVRPDTLRKTAPLYTSGVISTLGTLDWRGFLARPRLPSPALEVLDALYQNSMMITGAGGSIGSALAQRLGTLGPSGLLLLDSSESRLYKLQQKWASEGIPGAMTTRLGNVTDRTLLDEIFSIHSPRIIFHAAAFKHVPLLESQPLAALANNVFGTLTVTRAAAAYGARVVLLSTDKAVEPSSVMGATKRISELIVLAAGGTVLRLGNVLATRDSVTETFAHQIAEGKPLTVTDPAARRYFLTLDEAVNALLIAAAQPDPPLLLAPELSAPHFITDLAQFMAATLAPERAIEIDFTHPRPGDKEAERLWSSAETARPASHKGLLSIQSVLPADGELESALAALRTAVDARDLPASVSILREIVPDFSPSEALAQRVNHRVTS